MRLVVPSFAKVNLTLQVLNKRSDGFHNLRTVFHTISLADTISFDYVPSSVIDLELAGNVEIAENLISRAAKAFLETTGLGARLKIHLDKQIPMGAGLGGGSSNAAVALLALSRLTGTETDLHALASALGSDVPFFLVGGCALGEGRGTELTPLPDMATEPMLLVTPGLHVSTPPAFAALNRSPDYALLAAAEDVNDFETPVFAARPELASIKSRLVELGATKSLMSGSGSSIYAMFRSEAECIQAAQAIGYPSHRVRFVAREEYQSRIAGTLLP